ncbi:hypothetical protein BTH_I0568 [Burkholderia thailandensis E264]|uniref:Uncharacterized protein n=1 Tax=Burkholderia thailandensis (strain ATCC 700388 / DSM 13276 / CCUG 48851 / CIP 106301 / E264) TaxID=271848 RepID=Q2T124_BURTA|nr:hypothetical protein BTH_I0568 [Burkholderia thailandensis E264]
MRRCDAARRLVPAASRARMPARRHAARRLRACRDAARYAVP